MKTNQRDPATGLTFNYPPNQQIYFTSFISYSSMIGAVDTTTKQPTALDDTNFPLTTFVNTFPDFSNTPNIVAWKVTGIQFVPRFKDVSRWLTLTREDIVDLSLYVLSDDVALANSGNNSSDRVLLICDPLMILKFQPTLETTVRDGYTNPLTVWTSHLAYPNYNIGTVYEFKNNKIVNRSTSTSPANLKLKFVAYTRNGLTINHPLLNFFNINVHVIPIFTAL